MTATPNTDPERRTLADPGKAVVTPVDALSPLEQRVAAAEASAPNGQRRLRRAPRSAYPAAWPWRWLFPLVTLAAIVAIPILSGIATKAVLDSTEGVQTLEITDPAAPGFVALVSPTETLLAIHVDDADVLVGASLLTLKGDDAGGGTIIGFPAEFLASPAGAETPEPLHLSYSDGGAERVVDGIARLLGTRPLEVEVVTPALLSSLIAPVEGFEYSLIDDLFFEAADGRTISEQSGVVQIGADEALLISSALNGEPGIARATRMQRLWSAWMQAIRTSVLPDPIGGGSELMKTFVGRIAAGTPSMQPIPSNPFRVESQSQPLYVGLPDEIRELRNTVIPFVLPIEPGAVPVVELINGTGDLDQNSPAIDAIVEAGGLLSVVSNAQVFGVSQSRVIYYDPLDLAFVEALAAAMGGIDVQFFSVEEPTVDVVVTVGSDYRPQQ